MQFTAIGDTDIGNRKNVNQDAYTIKHCVINNREYMLATVCDGMGGLQMGEVASSTVIHEVHDWFDNYFINKIACGETADEVFMKNASKSLRSLLVRCNNYLIDYGRNQNLTLGTTISAIIFTPEKTLIEHVGDSRIYFLGNSLVQLTEDHTLIERQIQSGEISEEMAEATNNKNVLLQCVGAFNDIDPQIRIDDTARGMYLLCSDGFRHVITKEEIFGYLNIATVNSEEDMKINIRYLIDLAKQRGELDNISALLVMSE